MLETSAHRATNMSNHEPKSLGVGILTVSDTRTRQTDTSGAYLAEAAAQAGHRVVARSLLADDRYALRALVSSWIIHPQIQVILCTGGTGFSVRDVTPEALRPLLDREIEGFGEYFRAVSIEAVGNATIQSRTVAGFANGVAIFALPGSTNACRTAWTEILQAQLDSTHKPCNFVPHLKQACVNTEKELPGIEQADAASSDVVPPCASREAQVL